jgi:molybdopterin-binding protein
MKLSARNLLKGSVVDVRKNTVGAQIQIDVGGGNIVTSTITIDFANRARGACQRLALGKNSCWPSSL